MIETMDRQSPYALSPVPTNGYSNGAPQTDRWQPRRDSALRGSIRGNGSMSTGGRHNRQKSLSEAIRTVAARRGSVSANVHEIGDALKVPVSPTIIVKNHNSRSREFCRANSELDIQYHLVYVKCSHEYILESHLECLPKTCNPHPDSIRVRLLLLPLLLLASCNVSGYPALDTIPTAQDQISNSRCRKNHITTCWIRNRGSSSVFGSHNCNTSFLGPHH